MVLTTLVLAPGFEPGSRSNPELTGYKSAALPFVLRQDTTNLERLAGFEPAISTMARLRDRRLRHSRVLQNWLRRPESNWRGKAYETFLNADSLRGNVF